MNKLLQQQFNPQSTTSNSARMAVCVQKATSGFQLARTLAGLGILSRSLYEQRRIDNYCKIRYGDPLPSVNVYLDTPKNSVNMHELFKGKRGVLFSVLGAFTPGCSNEHIPEYLEHYDSFKENGYDIIACVAVNDPFVMSAWAKALDTKGKILMLADPRAEFTRALGMELDCRHILGTVRSRRYSFLINDGKVQGINHEPDHTGLACLLCIQRLKGQPVIPRKDK